MNAQTAQATDNRAKQIKVALRGVDHSKESDWTEDGKVSVKRVQQLAKDATITRDDIEKADPDFRREKPKPLVAATSRKDRAKVNHSGEGVENEWVKAVSIGQYGGKLRYVGERFLYTGKLKGWMIVVDEDGKEKATAKAKAE